MSKKLEVNPEFKEMFHFFKTEYPLKKEGLLELISLFRVKKIKKGNQLLCEGKEEKQLRFLKKGVVREYYSTPKKEINIDFYTKPQFISDLSSFTTHSKSNKFQESLTDVELLSVDKKAFNELLNKYECGKSFIFLSFKKLLKNKEISEYNRMTKSPEELYNELLIYKPHWLRTIPQYHIASFLNITPETLSRIRKRIS